MEREEELRGGGENVGEVGKEIESDVEKDMILSLVDEIFVEEGEITALEEDDMKKNVTLAKLGVEVNVSEIGLEDIDKKLDKDVGYGKGFGKDVGQSAKEIVFDMEDYNLRDYDIKLQNLGGFKVEDDTNYNIDYYSYNGYKDRHFADVDEKVFMDFKYAGLLNEISGVDAGSNYEESSNKGDVLGRKLLDILDIEDILLELESVVMKNREERGGEGGGVYKNNVRTSDARVYNHINKFICELSESEREKVLRFSKEELYSRLIIA